MSVPLCVVVDVVVDVVPTTSTTTHSGTDITAIQKSVDKIPFLSINVVTVVTAHVDVLHISYFMKLLTAVTDVQTNALLSLLRRLLSITYNYNLHRLLIYNCL